MPSHSTPGAWAILRNLLPLAGIVGVFCIAFFGEQGLMANRQLQAEMGQLQEEIGELRTANTELQEEVRALREEPLTIERTVREEMLMVSKDGNETVFVFPEGDAASPDRPTATERP